MPTPVLSLQFRHIVLGLLLVLPFASSAASDSPSPGETCLQSSRALSECLKATVAEWPGISQKAIERRYAIELERFAGNPPMGRQRYFAKRGVVTYTMSMLPRTEEDLREGVRSFEISREPVNGDSQVCLPRMEVIRLFGLPRTLIPYRYIHGPGTPREKLDPNNETNQATAYGFAYEFTERHTQSKVRLEFHFDQFVCARYIAITG